MKANAPEKIWLDSRSVFLNKPNKSGLTEYTRTDAFIKRACEWLDDELYCYIKAQDFTIDHARLNKDFKNYMKEE